MHCRVNNYCDYYFCVASAVREKSIVMSAGSLFSSVFLPFCELMYSLAK